MKRRPPPSAWETAPVLGDGVYIGGGLLLLVVVVIVIVLLLRRV